MAILFLIVFIPGEVDAEKEPLWSYNAGSQVGWVAISADGEYIVAGSYDYKIYLFAKDSSTPLWSYTTESGMTSVAISADGEYIVAGSDDNKVYLFNRGSDILGNKMFLLVAGIAVIGVVYWGRNRFFKRRRQGSGGNRLPDNWTQHENEDGIEYFYNSVTKESRSERPDSEASNENADVEEETRVDISKKDRAKVFRNVGAAIAICSILILVGGKPLSIWGFSEEREYSSDEIYEVGVMFSSMEMHVIVGDGFDVSDVGDESIRYSDCKNPVHVDDENPGMCENIEKFFFSFNLLLGVLMILGFVLAYNGHRGNIQFSTKLIAVIALISFTLIIYTMVSLPRAADEDIGVENGTDGRPSFYKDAEGTVEGYGLSWGEIKYKTKVGPSTGFFILLVQFGLVLSTLYYQWGELWNVNTLGFIVPFTLCIGVGMFWIGVVIWAGPGGMVMGDCGSGPNFLQSESDWQACQDDVAFGNSAAVMGGLIIVASIVGLIRKPLGILFRFIFRKGKLGKR